LKHICLAILLLSPVVRLLFAQGERRCCSSIELLHFDSTASCAEPCWRSEVDPKGWTKKRRFLDRAAG
jgi:hypothetical protein